MDERRQLPRWETKKKVKVCMPQADGFNRCVIEDIHLKGMCVSFNKPLPQQQALKMSFTIGDYFDPIKIEARICWEREDQGRYVYGLSFNRIEEHDKDRIYQYITTNCYSQFKEKWWA